MLLVLNVYSEMSASCCKRLVYALMLKVMGRNEFFMRYPSKANPLAFTLKCNSSGSLMTGNFPSGKFVYFIG